jgi:two-component system sensor histidine kinase/response regulator
MSNGPCAALLERVGGDEEIFAELCDLFLADAPTRLDAIRDAVAQGDPSALRRAAHAFKGAASVFDADDVVAAARALEEIGETGALDAAPVMWQALDAHSRTLIQTVRETRMTSSCRS